MWYTVGVFALNNVNLDLSLGFAPTVGDTFSIVALQHSGSQITGTFNGLAEGSTFLVDGNKSFSITYSGGAFGDSIILTYLGAALFWQGDGGDTNWSTTANWNTKQDGSGTDQLPGNDNVLVFDTNTTGLSSYTANNDISNLMGLALQLTDGNVGNDFTLSGNEVTIGASGITHSLTSGTATSISMPIRLGAAASFINNSGTLTISGDAELNGNQLTVDGTGDTTFSGAVNGSGNLSKLGSGTVTFGNAVGDTTALTSLTANAAGATRVNGGAVTTSGNQTYSGSVVLGANVTLTGSTVTFNSTLDSDSGNTRNLTISGNAVFKGAVGDTDALGAVAVSGTTTINVGTGNDFTLSNAGNNFSGAVLVTSAKNVTLRDTNTLDMGASTISGNLSLTAGVITDSGAIVVTGTTTLSASTGGAPLYVTTDDNKVLVLDGSANESLFTSGNLLDHPRGIAVRSDGVVWVASTGIVGTTNENAEGLIKITNNGSTQTKLVPKPNVNDITGVVLWNNGSNVSYVHEICVNTRNADSGSSMFGTCSGQYTTLRGLAVDDNDVRYFMTNPGSFNRLYKITGNSTVSIVSQDSDLTNSSAFLEGIAVDNAGFAYIADSTNDRIYKVNLAGGVSSNVSILSTGSNLDGPVGLAYDDAGFLYVASANNNKIVKVNASNGAQTVFATIAGGTSPQYLAFQSVPDPDITLDHGSNNFGGAVSVTAANNVTISDADDLSVGTFNLDGTLTLNAGGAITDSNGATNNVTIAGGSAAFSSAGGIGTSADPIETAVAVVAGKATTSGGVFITNSGGLQVDIVGVVDGILASGGGVIVVAQSPLRVSRSVRDNAGGDITLTAAGSTTNDNLTLEAEVSTTGDGGINLNAGNNIVIAQAGRVTAPGAGAINFNAGTGVASGGVEINGQVNVGTGLVTINAPGGVAFGATGKVTTGGGNVVITSPNGGITQAVGSQISTGAGGLGINVKGHATFSSTTNNVHTLGATLSGAGSSLTYTNAGPLVIGTVEAIGGITTNNGAADIESSGGMTVSNNIATGGGRLSLKDNTADVNLGTSQIATGGGNAIFQAPNGAVTQSAGGWINTGSGGLGISARGGATFPGNNRVGTLGVNLTGVGQVVNFNNDAPLTIGTVETIGGITTNGGDVKLTSRGNMYVNADIQTQGGRVRLKDWTGGLHLGPHRIRSGGKNVILEAPLGDITQDAAGIIDAGGAGLGITARGDVHLPGANSVATLGATLTGAGYGMSFTNSGPLVIGTVEGIGGITTNNGAADIESSGGMTVANNIATGGGRVSLKDNTADVDLGTSQIVTGGGNAIFQAPNGAVTQLVGGLIDTGGGGLGVAARGPMTLSGSHSGVSTLGVNLTGAGYGVTFTNPGPLVIGTVESIGGVSTNNGDVDIESSGGLTVTAAISTSGGRLNLLENTADINLGTSQISTGGGNAIFQVPHGAISQSVGGWIDTGGGGLGVSARGAATFLGDNVVATLGVELTGAGYGLTFVNTGPLEIGTVEAIGGVTTVDGDVSISTTEDMTVSQPIDVGVATVDLQASASGSRLTINADVTGDAVTLAADIRDIVAAIVGTITEQWGNRDGLGGAGTTTGTTTGGTTGSTGSADGSGSGSTNGDGTTGQAFVGNVVLNIPEGQPVFLPSLSGVTQAVSIGLSGGGAVTFPTTMNATVSVNSGTAADLPAELPGNDSFISSININIEQGDQGLGADQFVMASFAIPSDLVGSPVELLHWNPDANGGQGGWEAVPEFTVTPDNQVEAMVNSGGMYVLAGCDPNAGCGGNAVAGTNGVIPATGLVEVAPGQQVDLNTGTTEPVILSLAGSGQQVTVVTPVPGSISLVPQDEITLPGSIPPNTNYLSGLNVSLFSGDGSNGGVLGAGGLVMATMDIPEDATGTLAVLSWNPLLNGGAGGWVEVPNAQINANGQVEFPVFFGGTFVLVSQ